MTERFPLDGLGWQVLGALLKKMGRNADALLPLQKAATLSLAYPEPHYNLGNTLKQMGRLEEAASSYRQALKIKPDYAEALNNLGGTLKDMGRADEAEASYRRALELKPDYAEAYFNLGLLLWDTGRLDDAVANYRRALELRPGNAVYHYGFGNLLNELGQLETAAAHFRRCLELDPQDTLGARLLLSRLGHEPMPLRASDAHLHNLYVSKSGNWGKGSYYGHELVAQALKKLSDNSGKLDILDAGCGTGLVGDLVRDLASRLDGVDMSSAMLKTAREKGIYSEIHQGDLVACMLGKPGSYDAITCAATLIHFSDLAPVFDAAAAALRENGLFVFTLFPNENGDVAVAQNSNLAKGGCFAHSPDYVRRLAEAAGFVVELLDTDIHEYHKKTIPVMCLVVALRRRSS